MMFRYCGLVLFFRGCGEVDEGYSMFQGDVKKKKRIDKVKGMDYIFFIIQSFMKGRRNSG